MVPPLITMKKIAELAGVSRATVDKVLNGRPGVKSETKEKVLKIVNALHYQPNILGKALVAKEPVKIGVVLTPEYNPFIGEMLRGIKQAEQEYAVFNLQISVRMLSTLEPAEQVSVLRKLKAEGIQGLAVFPIDDERVKALINTFADDGIAVITFNSRSDGINSLCFVGQDHKKGGAVAAGLFQKLLPNGGKLGIIISSHSLSCHRDRLAGFQEQIREKGAVTILDVAESQDQSEQVFEITLQYCKRYPDLAGIYLTSGGVTGCAKALAVAQKAHSVHLVCHDVTPEAKRLLENEVVDFIIDQSPEIQGYQIIKILFEVLIKKQNPGQWFEIPVRIVIAESL